ncbi:MAG: RNA pseudouridine synthase, partial [Planctomycetota bacterium]
MIEGFSAQKWGVVEPRVLFEASGVVALEKPAGLPTQAPAGIESAESWLRRRLAGAGPVAAVYLGVPHRLDRAVSGVLLMAATPRAARQLSRQFERRQIGKTYIAVLESEDRVATAAAALEQAGTAGVEWRDLIEKVPEEPRARVVLMADGLAREAVTQARLLARLAAGQMLVELNPLTGRMHQLRLQAAVRGLPVAGDRLYRPQPDVAAGWTSVEIPSDDPR